MSAHKTVPVKAAHDTVKHGAQIAAMRSRNRGQPIAFTRTGCVAAIKRGGGRRGGRRGRALCTGGAAAVAGRISTIPARDHSEIAVAAAKVSGDVAAAAAAKVAAAAAKIAATEPPVETASPPPHLLPHEHAAEEPNGGTGSESAAAAAANIG
jgi:hypothetical protein